MDLISEFEMAQAKRLLHRFAECGEGVAREVVQLSNHLNQVRMRAESVAQGVAKRAEELNALSGDQQKKMEEFRQLAEEVGALSTAMSQLKQPEGETISDEVRAELSRRLAELEDLLGPLIERAVNLRQEARLSNMKTLEQNADSMSQTLQSLQRKLGDLNLRSH